MVRKVRDAIRRLIEDGWRQTSEKGSHRQLEHPSKPGKVTVAGHPNDDLDPKTWNSIQQQAGWK